MAAPLTPISPLPFLGFTATLPDDATVVELDPQPYSNTQEVTFLNLSTTDRILVQVADLSSTQAFADIVLGGGIYPETDAPVAGDTITIGASTLTAVGGTPGADQFSAPVQAVATIVVAASPLTAGDTISFVNALGTLPSNGVLTGVAGARVAGTPTFQVDAGTAILIADSVVLAFNDTTLDFPGPGNEPSFVADNAGGTSGTVTLTAHLSGTTPNADQKNWHVVSSTASGVGITPAIENFAGGVDAEASGGGVLLPNDVLNISGNISNAINDPGNSFSGTVTSYVAGVLSPPSPDYTTRVVAVAIGAAGNGIALSENTAGAIVVTTPTAGGTDAGVTAGEVTAANSVVIPPGGKISLAIGAEGSRQALADSIFWAANPGSKLGIVTRLETGTVEPLGVTYTQGRG